MYNDNAFTKKDLVRLTSEPLESQYQRILAKIGEAVKHKGFVEYSEDSFGANIKGIVPVQKCLSFCMKNGEVKVIGNIHDNPELLKGGEE